VLHIFDARRSNRSIESFAKLTSDVKKGMADFGAVLELCADFIVSAARRQFWSAAARRKSATAARLGR